MTIFDASHKSLLQAAGWYGVILQHSHNGKGTEIIHADLPQSIKVSAHELIGQAITLAGWVVDRKRLHEFEARANNENEGPKRHSSLSDASEAKKVRGSPTNHVAQREGHSEQISVQGGEQESMGTLEREEHMEPSRVHGDTARYQDSHHHQHHHHHHDHHHHHHHHHHDKSSNESHSEGWIELLSLRRSGLEDVTLAEGFSNTASENTELQARTLDFLMRKIPAAALVIDKQGNTIYHSKTMSECYGSDEAENWQTVATLAKNSASAYDAHERHEVESYPLLQTLRFHKTVRGQRVKFRRSGGSIGTLRMTCAPILDSAGDLEMAVAFLEDISSQVMVEDDLDAMKADQVKNEHLRKRSRFVATASHEIRTPVNKIIGLCDLLLLDVTLCDESALYAEEIRLSSRQLLSVVNTFLDFQKMENNKMAIEMIPLLLHDLLWNIFNSHSRQASSKHLLFEMDIAVNVPEAIMGDSIRLTQVINNLLDNAIKFVSHGGRVRIRCRLNERMSECREIDLLVEDDGIGVHPDAAARIFEPFVQADASTTRDHGGTGLGLAICSDLAKLMQGRVELCSTEFAGAGFKFSFRYIPVKPQAAQRILPAQNEADITKSDSQGKHILIAEDEKVNRMIFCKLVEKAGYRYTAVENGKEAVETIKANLRIDAILMDLMMPLLDGYAATQQIRAHESLHGLPKVPIAALSANCTKDDIAACFQSGMDMFIGKPCTAKVLYTKLDELLTTSKSDHEEPRMRHDS